YILCGGGGTGFHILAEFAKNKEAVVLIEQDEERIARCESVGDFLYVKGDATDDRNLLAAGIERARGIIISLPSDKDTLYVTMTARMLNKRLRIISSMADQEFEPKLKQAGANRVVSPNFIGALRMASEMIRPAAVEFLDQLLRSQESNLRINELKVTEKSTLLGKKISESGLEDKYGLLVLGARQNTVEIEFNPVPLIILEPGISLIVMGEIDNIHRAQEIL
ncbi:potassium channel family protein, partial [Thermodesulfobacteriota bacterium]